MKKIRLFVLALLLSGLPAFCVPAQEEEELRSCEGLYVQEHDDQSKVYTADLTFYYKDGVPFCSVDYNNFLGTLDDAPVERTDEDGYLFKSEPMGHLGSRDIPFTVLFSDTQMNISWGESCDYHFTRSTGAAEELEDKTPPFAESDVYASLQETIDRELGETPHHVSYDEDDRTVYLYIEMAGRDLMLKNASRVKERWEAFLESLEEPGKRIATAVTLATRDGLYDFTDGHSVIMIVEMLNDKDQYFPQDTLGMLSDGVIEYDFLEEAAPDTAAPENDPADTSQNNSARTDRAAGSATSGERNALQRAKDYLDVMAFSYSGLIEQLEYEGFSHSEAAYGADHCGADWYEQAAEKAADYLEIMSFSYSGLVEQLEYEGFTHEQAVYGADAVY